MDSSSLSRKYESARASRKKIWKSVAPRYAYARSSTSVPVCVHFFFITKWQLVNRVDPSEMVFSCMLCLSMQCSIFSIFFCPVWTALFHRFLCINPVRALRLAMFPCMHIEFVLLATSMQSKCNPTEPHIRLMLFWHSPKRNASVSAASSSPFRPPKG